MSPTTLHLAKLAIAFIVSTAAFRGLIAVDGSGIAAAWRVAALLGLTSTLCLVAYLNLRRTQSRDAHVFFGFCVLLFAGAYAVGALNLNITASGIAVARAERAADRAQQLANAVSCIADAVAVPLAFDAPAGADLEKLKDCRAMLATTLSDGVGAVIH